MFKIISLHIILVFILSPNFLFSQHYDIGYPENYTAIHEFIDDSTQIKEITYTINDHKKVKKVFNSDGRIIEDLVSAAHNNAKIQLKSKTSEEISKATGGIRVPGFKWPL